MSQLTTFVVLLKQLLLLFFWKAMEKEQIVLENQTLCVSEVRLTQIRMGAFYYSNHLTENVHEEKNCELKVKHKDDIGKSGLERQ